MSNPCPVCELDNPETAAKCVQCDWPLGAFIAEDTALLNQRLEAARIEWRQRQL